MEAVKFPGRVALQQRVLPAYRAPFFDALADACAGGLSLFAGRPLPVEHINTIEHLQVAHHRLAHNLHLLHPGSPLYQCWQRGILEWLQDWDPHALIVEANPRYPSTKLAVRWMHTRRRPVIGWGLGAPPLHGALGVWRRRARIRFIKSMDGLISYSQRGALEYGALGFPAERIFVAPNAVAPSPKKAPPKRPNSFNGRPAVLFVGRLQARKRIDNLLRACAALPEALQPRLWIVGDGPARSDFQAQAGEIFPQAEFTGAVYGAELDEYFKAADLFVLPGTGGLAVQQAMTFGLPVIVAQGDGTQDDLVRPQNGWQVPPDNLEALLEAMTSALSDQQRLRRMGAASFTIVSEEVNLERMVEVFVEALNTVLR
ncbi:glycosyltransferase family 4 protein [Chloroflexota bacterium]